MIRKIYTAGISLPANLFISISLMEMVLKNSISQTKATKNKKIIQPAKPGSVELRTI
jgi:hypothetical protein